MRTILLALCLVLTTQAARAADLYLFDLLRRQNYRAVYNRMLAKEPRVPEWLTIYGRTLNGPSQPATDIRVGNASYTLADVCKPHDCSGNKLEVVFAPNAREAWGRLAENGRLHWIGTPPAQVRSAVEARGAD